MISQNNNRNDKKLITYKVILVGDSVVGKSSLVQSLVSEQFQSQTVPTLGVDIQFKNMVVNNRNVQLQIWDTAGQDRYKSITRAYYKGADAIILVYDITDYNTFLSATNYWFGEMKNYVDEKTVKMFIGNKIDREYDRIVYKDKAQDFAQQNQMLFSEVTAVNIELVNHVFNLLIQQIIIQNGNYMDIQNPLNQRLNQNQPQPKNCWKKLLSFFGN